MPTLISLPHIAPPEKASLLPLSGAWQATASPEQPWGTALPAWDALLGSGIVQAFCFYSGPQSLCLPISQSQPGHCQSLCSSSWGRLRSLWHPPAPPFPAPVILLLKGAALQKGLHTDMKYFEPLSSKVSREFNHVPEHTHTGSCPMSTSPGQSPSRPTPRTHHSLKNTLNNAKCSISVPVLVLQGAQRHAGFKAGLGLNPKCWDPSPSITTLLTEPGVRSVAKYLANHSSTLLFTKPNHPQWQGWCCYM